MKQQLSLVNTRQNRIQSEKGGVFNPILGEKKAKSKQGLGCSMHRRIQRKQNALSLNT